MIISGEKLSGELERELGAGSVASDPAARAPYSVDGKIPAVVCFPSSAGQVSAVLRVSAASGAAVVPWGGGTSMALGNIPRGVDVVLALERLAKLIEHDDANLTATAEAGIKIAAFQETLSKGHQFLPIDPPVPSRATIGGIVAANTNGPRRMAYGGVRDLVIGMRMALATGEQIKAGGKVVKNVAGYDLCKLFVGSLGTLGIVTEVTLRVAPLPETAASFVASGALDRCARFVAELARSALLPAAVTIAGPGTATVSSRDSEAPAVVVWVEGFEEAVARHVHDLGDIAEHAGMNGEIFRAESHERLWARIRDFGANDREVLYKMTVPTGSVARVLATVERSGESGERVRYVAHAGAGAVWLVPDGDPRSMPGFEKLAALAREHRGYAMVAKAPWELKEGIDVWGEAPASLHLMRRVKREFDPKDVLSPGRFVAGV